MARTTRVGPRLEALLDERDHLRIKINLAVSNDVPEDEELVALRRRLLDLNREILKRWETPDL